MVADAATREAVRREETVGDELAEWMELAGKHDPWELSQLAEGKRRALALWAGEADGETKQGLLEIAAIFQGLLDADRRENRLHREGLQVWHVIAEQANGRP